EQCLNFQTGTSDPGRFTLILTPSNDACEIQPHGDKEPLCVGVASISEVA
ncbi:hypothetical protein NDU88_007462, partial [Pleurodeles waltl]